MKYSTYVQELVEALGGADNVESVTHCATRLRFALVDKAQADTEKVKSLKETTGVVEVAGTYQVIIGMHVADVYHDLIRIKGMNKEYNKNAISPEEDFKNKQSIFDRFLNTMSAIFAPYIPILASAGIIKGILSLFVNAGILSDASGTYAILYAASNSLIYFFPILLAFSASKKFGANPYIGAAIGAGLLEPTFAAVNVAGGTISFMGLPIAASPFENTVLPIIVGMFFYAKLEKLLRKYLPAVLQLVFVPVICLAVMVPAIVCVFGPIGSLLANGVGAGYNWLLSFGPIPISLLFGGFFGLIVAIGAHWVVLPLEFAILAERGIEYSLCAGGMGNYAVLGISLAVMLTSKDKQVKTMAASASFVNFLSGVTEPGIYGIVIKNKRNFVTMIVSGLTGGLLCGIFDCYITAFAFTGLFGLPAFMASPRFAYYALAVVVTIAISFGITFFMERKQG